MPGRCDEQASCVVRVRWNAGILASCSHLVPRTRTMPTPRPSQRRHHRCPADIRVIPIVRQCLTRARHSAPGSSPRASSHARRSPGAIAARGATASSCASRSFAAAPVGQSAIESATNVMRVQGKGEGRRGVPARRCRVNGEGDGAHLGGVAERGARVVETIREIARARGAARRGAIRRRSWRRRRPLHGRREPVGRASSARRESRSSPPAQSHPRPAAVRQNGVPAAACAAGSPAAHRLQPGPRVRAPSIQAARSPAVSMPRHAAERIAVAPLAGALQTVGRPRGSPLFGSMLSKTGIPVAKPASRRPASGIASGKRRASCSRRSRAAEEVMREDKPNKYRKHTAGD